MVRKEAKLVQLACSQNAPEGRARWTLNLLTDKVVELAIVPATSRSTVGRVQKTFEASTSRNNGLFHRIETPPSYSDGGCA